MSSPGINLFTNTFLRYLLFPLALLYWGIIFWRNLFYTVGFFVSHKLPCQVVSIGNISLGGTGKTPAVIYLTKLLQSKGNAVAILSRGYGRKTTGTVLVTNGKILDQTWQNVGDEPYLMAHQLPGVPIVVDANRYRGGVYLSQHFVPDVIILDDAFQHRQLERNLDVVLINAQDSVNDNKLIPFGRLREPWFHLRRAHLIFWTKTNLAAPSAALKSRANKLPVPNFTSTMETESVLIGLKDNLPLDKVKGATSIAVSAVGDPLGFDRTLAQGGLKVAAHIRFPDHHEYSASDIKRLLQKINAVHAKYIITTEKDLLKFATLKDAQDLPIYGLVIRFTPSLGGENALLRLLANSKS